MTWGWKLIWVWKSITRVGRSTIQVGRLIKWDRKRKYGLGSQKHGMRNQ